VKPLLGQGKLGSELSRGRRRYNADRATLAIAGYDDYRNGRPYPPAYDGWHKSHQENYEAGRLNAANAALANLTLPKIRVPTELNYARYRDLREAAIVAVGPAWPALS